MLSVREDCTEPSTPDSDEEMFFSADTEIGEPNMKTWQVAYYPMKESADEVLELLGIENNEILKIAKELERIALEDEYFIEKKLYPNVDFYSGIILDAMGFPTSMFTPIFALSRTVGWISQWKEMIADPIQKIGRPRQLYNGPVERDYIKLENR